MVVTKPWQGLSVLSTNLMSTSLCWQFSLVILAIVDYSSWFWSAILAILLGSANQDWRFFLVQSVNFEDSSWFWPPTLTILLSSARQPWRFFLFLTANIEDSRWYCRQPWRFFLVLHANVRCLARSRRFSIRHVSWWRCPCECWNQICCLWTGSRRSNSLSLLFLKAISNPDVHWRWVAEKTVIWTCWLMEE